LANNASLVRKSILANPVFLLCLSRESHISSSIGTNGGSEFVNRNFKSEPLWWLIPTLKRGRQANRYPRQKVKSEIFSGGTFDAREKDNAIYPIALANLVLHGIDDPHIGHGNTLTGSESYGGLFHGSDG
jgi:hypothetical protein